MSEKKQNHHDLPSTCPDCGAQFTTTVNLFRYDKIGIRTIADYLKRIGWKKVDGRYVTRCMQCVYRLGDETTPISDLRWEYPS